MNNKIKAFVIIATKGRAKETFTLLDYLAKQTYPIEKIVVVGSEPADIAGLEQHPLGITGKAVLKISKAGSCIQRNAAMDQALEFTRETDPQDWFAVFFDDDFRPANHWLEMCANTFIANPQVIGLGGKVVADGVTTGTISEYEAQAYLENNTVLKQEIIEPCFYGLYGCNMAYRGNVVANIRFDENLPLYGWQEDLDFGVRAIEQTQGTLIYTNQCIGVHLGVSGGRTSGVRFGYSQIANPIYLAKKGTMNTGYARKILLRNVASNIFHTIIFDTTKDYKGRLWGNIKAAFDLLTNKCHPTKILQF